ncbi:endo-1,4-beta-xylanase [Novosphingobium terrae]|uniref:endo-1,4-beta-xylanase n=1 Tax=Novosphingobium terrae TaxID=2726189 RepID=UPI00197DA55E|nr:endo-1,4-beta-xylanase [Novosphingobium terrae]
MPDRRAFLGQAAASLAGLYAGPVLAADSGFVPLGQVARAHGLQFGFALDPRRLSDARYAAFVAQQASLVVPENALKWAATHPAPDHYDFGPADTIASFARSHGIAMRGHTFCWHRSLPAWVTQTVTRQNAEAVLVDHIQTVAGHYRGMIHSWDVANEVINLADNLPGGWRDCFWHQMLGPAYVEIAAHAAHQADPGALLCYNDYGLESDSDKAQAKRKAVLAMLQGLKQRGVPIGGLGLQSHLRAGGSDSFGPGLAQFIQEVRGLGLTVLITELDVDDSKLDPATSDGVVAGVYKRYLDLVLGTGAVSAVLTWGVWDTPHYTAATPGQSGPMAQRPLAFGPDGSLKDASWAVEHCLMRARKV